MRKNVWFYRDRTGLPRGPCTLNTVRKCYANGIVDQHTLFWGNGLGDWVPLRNIRGMASSLSDPKTKFVKFLVDKFAFPTKDRRANRDAVRRGPGEVALVLERRGGGVAAAERGGARRG